MNCKNLILCFRHKALIHNNLSDTFCGLGDIIRGFIHCYLLSKYLNLKFYLDFEGHVLQNFVNVDFFRFDGSKPDSVPFIEGKDIESFLYSCSNENVFLMTNGDFNLNFQHSGVLREAFVEVFLSNDRIKKMLTSKFPSIKNVFHARFGDDKITSKDFLDNFYLKNGEHAYSPASWAKLGTSDSKYDCVFDFFSDSTDSFDFVSSDHLDFKKKMHKLTGISFNKESPCHLGLNNEDENLTINTLLDFYIIFQCEKIISLGSYPYGKRPSGFAFWPCFFNNIECEFYSFDFFRFEIKKLDLK